MVLMCTNIWISHMKMGLYKWLYKSRSKYSSCIDHVFINSHKNLKSNTPAIHKLCQLKPGAEKEVVITEGLIKSIIHTNKLFWTSQTWPTKLKKLKLTFRITIMNYTS